MTGRHANPDSYIEERRRRRGLILMATTLGVLLSGAMVLTASRAAFSSQTENSGNSFEAGDVALTDDDSGSAMFTVTNMAPDDPAEVACIEVTYSGTIADPGEVRLFSSGFLDSGILGDELDITVEVGTGGDFSSCAGFTASGTIVTTQTLATFDTTFTDYASGAVGWDPTATPDSRTFRFTIDLPSDAASAVQGNTVTDLVFTWEVQS